MPPELSSPSPGYGAAPSPQLRTLFPDFWRLDNLVRAEARYLVKTDPVDLKTVMDEFGLQLVAELRTRIDKLEGDDVKFSEVVVTPNSLLRAGSGRWLRCAGLPPSTQCYL